MVPVRLAAGLVVAATPIRPRGGGPRRALLDIGCFRATVSKLPPLGRPWKRACRAAPSDQDDPKDCRKDNPNQ
jgi:hypothetical protein